MTGDRGDRTVEKQSKNFNCINVGNVAHNAMTPLDWAVNNHPLREQQYTAEMPEGPLGD